VAGDDADAAFDGGVVGFVDSDAGLDEAAVEGDPGVLILSGDVDAVLDGAVLRLDPDGGIGRGGVAVEDEDIGGAGGEGEGGNGQEGEGGEEWFHGGPPWFGAYRSIDAWTGAKFLISFSGPAQPVVRS
jgi:hypothetical protein